MLLVKISRNLNEIPIAGQSTAPSRHTIFDVDEEFRYRVPAVRGNKLQSRGFDGIPCVRPCVHFSCLKKSRLLQKKRFDFREPGRRREEACMPWKVKKFGFRFDPADQAVSSVQLNHGVVHACHGLQRAVWHTVLSGRHRRNRQWRFRLQGVQSDSTGFSLVLMPRLVSLHELRLYLRGHGFVVAEVE